MGKIILLDNNTIQKIAAGEVVERPSSIVKELIENSIDACSKNITIEIKNGGKDYIRVTDDGDGIESDDIDLAFASHSTSKLSVVEDLYKIKSLGFRGEALASISHVSKVEVMTKTENAVGGIHAIVEEGKIISKDIIGCPKGTTMIVKDLFYNLPVRKDFLKSDLSETNHISDIVYKIALGNLNVSFKFIKDDKVILKTSKNNNMNSHIYSVLGKEFANNLTEVNIEELGIKINGYISNNKLYRSNRNHQYLYINGRYINNYSISHVIGKHYKSIIPLNRFPVFILFISIDPSSIDINIHPTKQEIKFVNQSEIFTIIDETIRNTLFGSISIPKVSFENNNKSSKDDLPFLFDISVTEVEKGIVIKDFTGKPEYFQENTNFQMQPETQKNDYSKINGDIYVQDNLLESKTLEKDQSTGNIESILSNVVPIGSIFNTYILAEDRINDKIYFIDQHAAHERVMYEKYLNEFKSENIVSQQLLAPEILELTNQEMNNFVDNSIIFNKLGFDIEEFGTNSVAIRAVPLIFGVPNIKDLFYDLLDNINKNIKSTYELKLEKVMKIACVNAVKGGDYMTEIEVFSLLTQLKMCQNPHSCPHGRPTILEMSRKDIEKAFLRIM